MAIKTKTKMSMTRQLISSRLGREVSAGEIVMVGVDMVLGNDITSPVAIKEFESHGFKNVFDKNKIALVLDHFVPCKDILSANQCKIVREFASRQGIKHFFDAGDMGIEHALLPEKGIVKSGDIVIGADSHTCTYGALGAFSTGVGSTDMAFGMATGKVWLKVPEAVCFVLKGKPKKWVGGKDVILHILGEITVSGALYKSMEFCGEGLRSLSMDDRFTIANMAIEAGAKNGIFETDEITSAYENERNNPTFPLRASEISAYGKVYEIDLSEIDFMVSAPHSPDNAFPVNEISGVKVDQCVIGSCTNGRISDLAAAAEILSGKKVHSGTRTIIIPATQDIYLEALRKGYIEIFIKAGCVVSTPTCGPCLGGHMGVLADGEKAIATTNRNFLGRMGHPGSEVYLSGPAVAAASAIAGEIVSPFEAV